jgi:glucose-6-phosphate 1-dehydrogenase
MGTTAEATAPPALGNAAPGVCADSQSDQSTQARTVAGGCLSVVVLGASGDLAKKKTFPALFNLYKQVQWAPICVDLSSLSKKHYLV